MPRTTDSITLAADSLAEAVQACVDRARFVAEERGFGGFTAPAVEREAFELIDGEWQHTYRFVFEFLPPRES